MLRNIANLGFFGKANRNLNIGQLNFKRFISSETNKIITLGYNYKNNQNSQNKQVALIVELDHNKNTDSDSLQSFTNIIKNNISKFHEEEAISFLIIPTVMGDTLEEIDKSRKEIMRARKEGLKLPNIKNLGSGFSAGHISALITNKDGQPIILYSQRPKNKIPFKYGDDVTADVNNDIEKSLENYKDVTKWYLVTMSLDFIKYIYPAFDLNTIILNNVGKETTYSIAGEIDINNEYKSGFNCSQGIMKTFFNQTMPNNYHPLATISIIFAEIRKSLDYELIEIKQRSISPIEMEAIIDDKYQQINKLDQLLEQSKIELTLDEFSILNAKNKQLNSSHSEKISIIDDPVDNSTNNRPK